MYNLVSLMAFILQKRAENKESWRPTAFYFKANSKWMVFYHHDLPPEGRPLPGGSLIINLVRIEVSWKKLYERLKKSCPHLPKVVSRWGPDSLEVRMSI